MALVTTQWMLVLMLVVLLAFVVIRRFRKDKNPVQPLQ
jgi:hypothetical protein